MASTGLFGPQKDMSWIKGGYDITAHMLTWTRISGVSCNRKEYYYLTE